MSSFLTGGSIDSSSVDKMRRSMGFFKFSTCLGNGLSIAGDNFFFGVGAKSLSDEALLVVDLRFTACFVRFSTLVDLTIAIGFDFFPVVDAARSFKDDTVDLDDDATATIEDLVFGTDFLDKFAIFVALEIVSVLDNFLSEFDAIFIGDDDWDGFVALEDDGVGDFVGDRTAGVGFLDTVVCELD